MILWMIRADELAYAVNLAATALLAAALACMGITLRRGAPAAIVGLVCSGLLAWLVQ
jgi:hypothetical protein